MGDNLKEFSDIRVSHDTAAVLKAKSSLSRLFNDVCSIDDVAEDKSKYELFSNLMNAISDLLDKELLQSIYSQQDENTNCSYMVI